MHSWKPVVAALVVGMFVGFIHSARTIPGVGAYVDAMRYQLGTWTHWQYLADLRAWGVWAGYALFPEWMPESHVNAMPGTMSGVAGVLSMLAFYTGAQRVQRCRRRRTAALAALAPLVSAGSRAP